MPTIRLLFTAFVLIYLPLTSTAQDGLSHSQEEKIQQIFEQTTITQMVDELPHELKNQFSQNPFGISAADNEQLITLFEEHFNADSLHQVAQKNFIEQFNPDYADSVLTTLQSDSLKPVIKTELDFYTVQGTRKQIITKYELEKEEPSQDRITLVKNVMEQRSAKDSEIEAQTILFRSFVIGTDIISSELALGEQQVEAIIENFTNRMQMQLEDELINNYLVMYHGLDDDQLEKYADFYATEGGQEFKESANKALQSALEEGADRFLNSAESL
ncbi:MAG: hypothetical protein ACQEST_12380 [Bacteroidota bacterium]